MDVDDQQGNWHDDFTTASQWEIFIARIEEALYDWKLPQLKTSDSRIFRKSAYQVAGKLEFVETNLQFSDTDFVLRYFYRNFYEPEDEATPSPEERDERLWGQDLMESDILDDESEKGITGVHFIEQWYGVSRFLLLCPAQNYAAIASESKAKLLLSSAKIAISNSKCPIPIFVQVHQPHQQYFLGTWQGPGMQTDFTMIHLRQAPKHCKYLTGLLDILKGKLAAVSHSPAHSMATPIEISARIHFVLRDWPMNQWMQSPPDFELLHGQVGVEHIGKLPFGAESDPLRELHLLAQWRSLPEGVLVDHDGYSDLAPGLASRWTLEAHMAPSTTGLLGKSLGRLLNLCTSSATLKQLLGDLVTTSPESSISYVDSLNALTEPKVPSWSKLVPNSFKSGGSSSSSANSAGPIPHQMLMTILYYLFPDADENGPVNPYPASLEQDEVPRNTSFKEKGHVQFKSCPVDCLVWRLAIVTALVADASHGGLRAAAHLWHEVCQEMRYRWDHSIAIPGLVAGCPDLRSCLFSQKLQMLNYCIMKRQDRERRARTQKDVAEHSDNEFQDVPEASSEDEDEFYECDDEVGEPRKKKQHSLWDKPEGRLSKDSSLMLIDSNEPLYIPITQEPPPKTEDQRHEDAEILMMLGDDSQGSELRAQIMSPLLLSDMESFKAANPGSCLGDFVRWYSPRDWIEEENKLSPRMLIKGNTWQELWTAAKPVPASRQKRLFDDTKEAERVLRFLENQKPAEAFLMLMPALLHSSINRLGEEWLEELSPLSIFNSLQEKAGRLTTGLTPNHKDYSRFVDLIGAEEMKIAQLKSLQEKFGDVDKAEILSTFLCDLLQCKEVEVPDGPDGAFGRKISSMFLQAQKINDKSMAKIMQRAVQLYGTIIERLHFEYKSNRTTVLEKRVRVLCWISTCEKNHQRKAIHVKSTWARRCDKLIFISEFPDSDLPTVIVDALSSRKGLAMKTVRAFQFIYKKYFDDFDWFLKADDDTYVVMENLRQLLVAQNAENLEYFGLRMRHIDDRIWSDLAPEGYMTGAAYVLSRESLKLLVTRVFVGENLHCSQVTKTMPEDMLVAHCLNLLGVRPVDTRDPEGNNRFSHYDIDTYVNGLTNVSIEAWYFRHMFWPQNKSKQRSKIPIAFHYMAPHKFYQMEKLLYGTNIFGVKNLAMVEVESSAVSLPAMHLPIKQLVLNPALNESLQSILASRRQHGWV